MTKPMHDGMGNSVLWVELTQIKLDDGTDNFLHSRPTYSTPSGLKAEFSMSFSLALALAKGTEKSQVRFLAVAKCSLHDSQPL